MASMAKTWNLPWKLLKFEKDEPEEVIAKLTCRLMKVPLVIKKQLILRSNEAILHINETITNESQESIEYMWGHHPSFGAPFVNPDCVLDVPADKVAVYSFPEDSDRRFERGSVFDWPNMSTREGEAVDGSRMPEYGIKGSDELCFTDMREGWYALTDARRRIGFGLEWDIHAFPYLWYWQAFGVSGYPWYGRTYNCALEPWSSYPLFGLDECVKFGTSRTLGPGESSSAWLKAVAYSGISGVLKIENGSVISK